MDANYLIDIVLTLYFYTRTIITAVRVKDTLTDSRYSLDNYTAAKQSSKCIGPTSTSMPCLQHFYQRCLVI